MELVLGKEGFELIHPSKNWKLKPEVGFSPVEMLAASVGSCGAYVYQKVLNNSNITHDFKKVEILFERSETKQAKPLKSITILFYLQGVSLDEQEKAERAIQLIEKHCPVMQSLDPKIKIQEQVIFS